MPSIPKEQYKVKETIVTIESQNTNMTVYTTPIIVLIGRMLEARKKVQLFNIAQSYIRKRAIIMTINCSSILKYYKLFVEENSRCIASNKKDLLSVKHVMRSKRSYVAL